MAEITFHWNQSELGRSRKTDGAITRAVKRSGNEAIKALRAEGKRQVRQQKRIRAGYLADKALPIQNARGTRLDSLEWTMRVSGQPVPLGEFPRRQTKKGVSVEVNRGQRKLIQSAFLARTRTGKLGVFLRPTEARYPMGHRLGPNVADSMQNDTTVHYIQLAAHRRFAQQLGFHLDREMKKLK